MLLRRTVLINRRALKRFFEGDLKYLVLFILVSVIFHYRVFLDGILIAPNNDALQLNYPIRHLYSYALKSLQFPLWNPYEFAGMPFLGEMQNGALYPLNLILYFFLSAPYAYNLSYILHFALAGFFTFLYVRLIGARTLPSFLSGLVFAFSGFLIAGKDHTAIVNSAVYISLIMYFYEKLRRKPMFKYCLLIALTVAVQLFAGNMQICVYTYMVVSFFLIFWLIRKDAESRGRFLIYGVLGLLIGFVIALPQIISTMELSGLSWMQNTKIYRGYEYFSLYHLYLTTLPSMIFPSLFNSIGPKDATPVLLGILPLVVAFITLLKKVRTNSHVQFFGIVAVVSLLLSFGSDTPLNKVLYHVPVYNMFRAHGRNLFEFTLAVSVLFAIGLNSIFYDSKRLFLSMRFPSRAFKYLFVLLLSFEIFLLSGFNKLSGIPLSQTELCASEPYSVFLKKDLETGRIANIFKDINTSNPSANLTCRMSSINAYDPFSLEKYSSLLDLWLSGYYTHKWDNNLRNNIIMGMLGVKYIKVMKDMGLTMNNILTADKTPVKYDVSVKGWRPVNALLKAEGHYSFQESDKGGSEISTTIPLSQGAYVISLKVKAQRGADNRTIAFLIPLLDGSSEEILHIIPDHIRKEFKEFHGVFHIKNKDLYLITIATFSNKPVEIKDIKIERLNDYAPLFLGQDDAYLKEISVYELVSETNAYEFYLNRNYLPRVWSVRELISVKDFSEIKRRLDLLEINPAKQAMVYECDMAEIGEITKGEVSITDYRLNSVTVDARFSGKGVMVLADQYYPGWRAFIDGKEAKIYEVNGILRGVVVPEGKHVVIFRYLPYKVVALIGLSLFIVIGIIVYLIKRNDIHSLTSI
ncbi:MAG: YfhO family protein [Nitrospirae bacterium]|nr:YfhO family protein [Nitrospirota bacterium]